MLSGMQVCPENVYKDWRQAAKYAIKRAIPKETTFSYRKVVSFWRVSFTKVTRNVEAFIF